MIVRLIPKTHKAKQRVKKHGDTGVVISRCSWVMLVEAGDSTSRWVNVRDDQDFDWVEMNLTDCENRVLEAMHDLP